MTTLPPNYLKLSSKWLIDNPLPEDARYYNVLFRSWESTKWAGYLLDHVLNQGYIYATARTDLPREAYADSEIRPMTHEERKALDEFTMAELRIEPGAEVASERAEDRTVRFVSAVSGLQYEKLEAAGDIMSILVGGEVFSKSSTTDKTIATLRAQLEAKEAELQQAREGRAAQESELTKALAAYEDQVQSLEAERDKLRAEVANWRSDAFQSNLKNQETITNLLVELDAVRKERYAVVEKFRKAEEWNKLTELELKNLRSLNSDLSQDIDSIDMLRDEFRRIASCPDATEEIKGLCKRALQDIKQRVPVIKQRDTAIADRDRMADEREKLKAILGVGGLHYQPNLPIALETRLHAEKGRRDQLATESAGLKLERYALAEQCAKLQIRVGELEASLEEARKVPSVEAKERAEKECAELREELRRWHSIANDFANRRNRAEISAADLRESIADLEEAHGGALIAQAAAVRGMETAEEQFRKAAEWNKLTNLEIENLRSLNAGLEEDLITERNPNVDGSLAFHLASSNQRENDLRTLLLELCEKMEAGLSGAEETKRARAMLGDDPAGGVTISTEKKGGDEPCAPQAINCNAPVVGRDQVQMITTQQDAQSTESASNPQPESPIPSGVGQPSHLEPVIAGECPICGALEVEANHPRTFYACGSSDYDQRPGTFIQSARCVPPIAPEGKATEGEG